MFANPFGDRLNPLGISYDAIYIAAAISAVIGTVLSGMLNNLPLVLASSMGLKSFLCIWCASVLSFGYANALALVLLYGDIYCLPYAKKYSKIYITFFDWTDIWPD